MGLISFFKGLIIGLSIAAPVGPIGVLCIQRTLAKGRLAGLATGLGAATADGIYGLIAGFGITLISSFLISQQTWIRLLGGIFLCYLGISTFISKPAEIAATIEEGGLIGSYFSTLLLTLTNPMTIISFMGIFASLGSLTQNNNYTSAAILVLGVFLGSALWWLMLSFIVSTLRSKFRPTELKWINKLSGTIIVVFGLATLTTYFA
ncbi:MAG: LysE family translocator [Carboxydocellales bacterium]